MAIINCFECGKGISDKAIECPGCGVKVNDTDLEKKAKRDAKGEKAVAIGLMVIMLPVIIAFIAFFIYMVKQI